MNLIEALRSPEGKTLEFKRNLSSPDGFKRTVVAFANTAGGTILVGVEDKTGYVRGVEEPLALEERVASLISDSISPRVLPDIEFLSYRDTQVLAVQIYPSATRPHFITRQGLEAGTYVRVGSTNRRSDADLVAEMQRYARGEAYDEQPMPELDSEAIDFRVVCRGQEAPAPGSGNAPAGDRPPGAQGTDHWRCVAVRSESSNPLSRRLDSSGTVPGYR